MKSLKHCIAAALLAGTSSMAQAADLEVTHWWTSGGEAAAVKVLADNFNKTGHNWKDSVQAGFMTDLTELAEKEGWKDIVRPSKLLDSCTYEGKIFCVPVNIHSFQWMWLNRSVFTDNGMEVPKSWDEMTAMQDKLKEKNIIPLALGGEPWQISGLAGVLTVALGGVELHTKINVEKSVEAAESEIMTRVFEALGNARSMVDPGNVGRAWNTATNMVITGKAASQIMGDWAQGEFAVAGQVAGKDYDCLPGLGINPVLDTGQLAMASMLMSKQVQVDFNLKKGSLPIRGDIDMSAANDCMQKGIKILEKPENILPSSEQVWSPDTQGQFEDLWVEFFSSPEMKVADAQARFVNIIKTAD